MWSRILLSAFVLQFGLQSSALSVGNEGSGGGSAVQCPGTSSQTLLELTDLNEARARRPELGAFFDRMRAKSESEIRTFVVDQLEIYLSKSDPTSLTEPTRQKVLDLLERLYSSVYFGSLDDPMDSGRVHLAEPSCKEVRVAVNAGYDVYLSTVDNMFSIRYLTVIESEWKKLPVFDRYGLILHELLYAISEGRVTFKQMDPFQKTRTSESIRRVVGLIMSGDEAKKIPSAYDFSPQTQSPRSCWGGTSAVRRNHSSWDRIHFDILQGTHSMQKIISFTSAWGVAMFLPNFATVDVGDSIIASSGSDMLRTGKINVGPTTIAEVNLSGAPRFFSSGLTVSFHTNFANYGVLDTSHEVAYLKIDKVKQDGSLETIFDGAVVCNP